MADKYFPSRPEVDPRIYAYMDTNPQYDGLLKIGYTTIDVKARVSQQYPILRPGEKPYKILLSEPAIRNDGTSFTDHDVHKYLKRRGFENPNGEWFKCSVDDVKNAIIGIKERRYVEDDRSLSFSLRPEQKTAIEKTINYIKDFRKENPN
ncbi:MAG TPA: GIY-YIG nuclease family protein, partial [Spirochaetota bacterium]|nr:GIY-YIG nuclease family protein [Spirochaetota bacterium]